MALKKNINQNIVTNETFNSLTECIDKLSFVKTSDERHEIFNALVLFKDGAKYLVSLLEETKLDRVDLEYIISVLSSMNRKEAPIDEILDLLYLENAFIRNGAISILRDYDDEIIYFIVKSLLSPDRDIRILALNVLGDVTFSESRDLMIDLLEHEEDLNVAMTAVDYLSEIGIHDDIRLLEKLKHRFHNDAYVVFAVDRAIKCIRENS